MMNSALGTGLRTELPDLEVHVSAGDLAAYSYDGTAARMARPSAVVFATDTEQVSCLLRFALRRKISVVTRGSGTGLSGGSVPVDGCIVLCLTKMNRIIEVDAENLTLLA